MFFLLCLFSRVARMARKWSMERRRRDGTKFHCHKKNHNNNSKEHVEERQKLKQQEQK